MKERVLPVDGAMTVYLLDGSLTSAWPATKVRCRPWYIDNPDGPDPILTHIEIRLMTRWERLVNRFRRLRARLVYVDIWPARRRLNAS